MITIQNFLPIINGFVIISDGRNNYRLPITDALTAVYGSYINWRPFHDKQRTFCLPTYDSRTRHPVDYYGILRSAASCSPCYF